MNLLDPSYRKKIIDDINSWENKSRKALAFRANEIFNDRIHSYVVDYLRTQFSAKTVTQIPIVSTINIARRVTKEESLLYKGEVHREFSDLSEDQKAIMMKIYEDGSFNTKLDAFQEMYRYLKQCLVQVALVKGQLQLRVIKPHQWDAIPDEDNPETAAAYIISSFDRQYFLPSDNVTPTGTSEVSKPLQNFQGQNQAIADVNDYKKYLGNYIWWSEEHNFKTNAGGDITSETTENPIGMMPFIEIASGKDFEYWVRLGNVLADFTVQYNGSLSDVGQVVRMQGWAQAYFKGPKDLLPENLQIGHNFVLMLPIDPKNPVETEFGYANPSPDVQGSLNYVDRIFNDYLASRGISKRVITGEASYASGLERLVAMIERYELSMQDANEFQKVEQHIFKIIIRYIEEYQNTEFLSSEYWLGSISPDAEVGVNYKKPEMIMTEFEKLEILSREDELGLSSKIDLIAKKYNLDRQQAIEKLELIKKDNEMIDEIESVKEMPITPQMPMTFNPSMEEEEEGEEDAENS